MSETPSRFGKRVAIIGAGISGISALRQLRRHGVDAFVLEKEDRAGGLWVYHDEPGRTTAYKSVHVKGPREEFGFLDFPMGPEVARFPSWHDIVTYLDRYIEHHALGEHIQYGREVTNAWAVGDEWVLALADGSERTVDALVVASGHHQHPLMPEPAYPGCFDGVQIHSHEYQENLSEADHRTLVVGAGNSAIDITVDAAWVADQVFMSVRRGFQVFPQTLLGRPRMYALDVKLARLPRGMREALMARMLRWTVGTLEEYGMPRPQHSVFATRPTISDTFAERLTHGAIVIKPGIARLDGGFVEFTDGSREQIDRIIWATGYRIVFDYLDDPRLKLDDTWAELFLHVFPPDIPNLYFVGLLQPLGTMPRIATVQSEAIAAHLTGRFELPSTEKMREEIRRDVKYRGRQLVDSPRHRTQVEVKPYFASIDRAMRRGGRGRRPGLSRARDVSWS